MLNDLPFEGLLGLFVTLVCAAVAAPIGGGW